MPNDLLKARIDDALRLARKAPHFIGFLDPGERAEAEDYLRYNNQYEHMFFGGYDEAERSFLGVFPDYLEPMGDYFPIAAITFTYKPQYELSHRDFLGSLMAQGITRSSLGDILIEKGRAVIFIKEELQEYIMTNISKIGKVGVTPLSGFEGELPVSHHFQEISGVIASMRLDCVVAFLAGASRDKAATLISSGLVTANYREATSNSAPVNEGTVISIRGKGKFIVDVIGPQTKKGRTIVKCRKYI